MFEVDEKVAVYPEALQTSLRKNVGPELWADTDKSSKLSGKSSVRVE